MSVISEMIMLLPQEAKRKMLDIGCARGDLLDECKDQFQYLVGVDLSKDLLRRAQKKLGLNGEIGFFASSASMLAIKPETFSTTICSEVIEHVDDADKTIQESKRILEPGGYLVITFPVWWVEKLISSLNKNFMNYSGHLRSFRLKEIEPLLQKYNFKIIKKKGYYFEWTILYIFEAVFSKKFNNIDRRYDQYAKPLEISRWDRVEEIVKRIVKRLKRNRITAWLISVMNSACPKSLVFLCQKQ